jgi:hypothetical protein
MKIGFYYTTENGSDHKIMKEASILFLDKFSQLEVLMQKSDRKDTCDVSITLSIDHTSKSKLTVTSSNDKAIEILTGVYSPIEVNSGAKATVVIEYKCINMNDDIAQKMTETICHIAEAMLPTEKKSSNKEKPKTVATTGVEVSVTTEDQEK